MSLLTFPYLVPYHMVFVLVSLLLCMTITRSCKDEERQALLDIKANLVDKDNNLQGWGNEKKDCCQWAGVECDNKTGLVIEFDLSTFSYNSLSGNISSSLPLLSQLQYLDLSWIDFQLNPIPIFLSYLTNLRYLSISGSNLTGPVPHQLANLSNLIHLDLSSNFLSGLIPASFGDLTSLTSLDLSNNLLEGAIPKSFENLLLMENLDLSRNGLIGSLPITVGKLSNLTYLDISSNFFKGLIYDDNFINLTKLVYLDLSFNSFVINLSSNAKFRFKLKTIRMQSCKLGPSFPMWIKSQRDFEYLDISNARISGNVPRWFWDLPHGLKSLNLSSNEINGTLPNMTSVFEVYVGMDLSNNQLEGLIPVLPSKLAALNLSGNRFSGTLSFLCKIDGFMTFLDLSNNLLSGVLPDCLQKFSNSLSVLNLSNNRLSGAIPSSLGFISKLKALYLRRNSFHGEIPMALSNCTSLRFVDLGENELSGNIPSWIGETLSELYVLVLRANKFNGSLPSQICLLNNLQFLDLSSNGLSSNIPRCFGKLEAMSTKESQDDIMSHTYTITTKGTPCGSMCITPLKAFVEVGSMYKGAIFIDNALVAWKGTQREFGRGLYLLKGIDISSNKLYGKLPDEITNIFYLVLLNVSNNKLHGKIPKHMGQLRSLESLDLSRNAFSGVIPSSLSQLTSLSYLDLSYNNLSGRIPTGTQLQGFNYTFYSGNPLLCGPPVTPRCGLPPPPATVAEKEDDEEDEEQFWKSYYSGMGSGFAVGFSGICGTLYLNRPCRYIFFGLLITMKDWIYRIRDNGCTLPESAYEI